jgi:hypothetical protein
VPDGRAAGADCAKSCDEDRVVADAAGVEKRDEEEDKKPKTVISQPPVTTEPYTTIA